jgi:putative transposase
VGDEPTMRDWAAEFVEWARSEGVELTGDNGLSTALVRQVVQTSPEVDVTDYLGYETHAAEGRGRATAATAATQTATTEVGKVDLRVPGDRNSSFCATDVAQGSTSVGRRDRERDLALRQGHDAGDI